MIAACDCCDNTVASICGGLAGATLVGVAVGIGVSYRIAWRWLYRPRPH